MTRYPFLYVWSILHMVIGVVIWGITAAGVIGAAVAGPNFQVDFTNAFSRLVWAVKTFGVAESLLVGGLVGLASLAAAQFILMLMDMADDTRMMRLLKDREALEKITGKRP